MSGAATKARLEVHSHSYVGDERGAYVVRVITHSHEGGDVPHQHGNFGPATYTIDSDAWFAATGQRGGGKKRFTVKPSGPQLPLAELEEWQKRFTIIIGEPVTKCPACGDEHGAAGGALPTTHRMIQAFRMAPRIARRRSVQ